MFFYNSANSYIIAYYINNAANATIAVFDIVGKTIVKDQRMASNKGTLAVPHKGIYLVRINNNTVRKVLVR